MYDVLLVEDTEEGQIAVKRALSYFPINLVVKSTVSEAKDYIKSKEFSRLQLAILDLSLPDGEGISILEMLRKSGNPDIPVFLLTSCMELDSKVTPLI